MTSINTNLAAVSALRTLQATNTALDATQNRISTGLKIGEAKDNAAYWSIATTMKSDNKAMETVKDALGLGAASVDTAYQGLTAAKDVLDQIKSKLTSATQPGVDRAAVQAEIKALQDQLVSIANSATFSGENWLAISTVGYDTKTVVSGFNRLKDGTVNISTINVPLSGIALTGSDANTKGLLDTAYNTEKAVTTYTTGGDVTFDTDTTISFDLTVNGGSTKGGTQTTVVLSRADVNAALGISTGVLARTRVADVLNWKFASMGINDVSAVQATNNYTLTAYSADKTAGTGNDALVVTTVATGAGTGGATAATALGMVVKADGDNVKSTLNANALNISISDAALTGASATTEAQKRALISAYISAVNVTINKVTAAASSLGAVAARIDLQQTFVGTLMDTIEKGVSGLVDADMNEESTKLQALQVKQQLGVQALSIANQSAQNVLSLFRS